MVEQQTGISAEIQVGQVLEEREYVLTPDFLAQYTDAVQWPREGNEDSWMSQAAILAAVCKFGLSGAAMPGGGRRGTLHTAQEFKFYKLPRPGQRITVRSTIVDQYERRGREWVTMEVVQVDEEGNEIVRGRSTQAWLLGAEKTNR